jgi:hypothetical protein
MPRYGKDPDGKEWVYYCFWEVRYSQNCVAFLLPYLVLLSEGRYPPDPTPNGYTSSEVQQTSVDSTAAFIKASEIYSELTRRLKRCWPDDDLLEHYCVEGIPLADIARSHYITEEDCWNRMQNAISYISSGPAPRWVTTKRRRGLSYPEWCSFARKTHYVNYLGV